MASRILKLRRPDVCVVCGTSIEAGSEAWWDAGTNTVTCLACRRVVAQPPNSMEPELLDRGNAGASARREYERRKTSREASVRGTHRHIGGVLLWLKDAPQHEIAFKAGELGEVAVGESLDRRTAEGPAIILHDRRMPRGRGNIDHGRDRARRRVCGRRQGALGEGPDRQTTVRVDQVADRGP